MLTNFGTIAGTTAVYLSGANDRVIASAGAVFSGTLRASGSGHSLELAAGTQSSALKISGFTNLQFDAHAIGTVEGSAAGLPGTITGFAAGDTIDVDGFVAVSDTYTGGGLVLTDGASNHVTLGIQGSFSTSDFAISSDSHGGTNVTVTIPCFCRGTRILTERGEVAVEALAVGDRVKTLSGALRPIVWIGMGRDLVTRRNRLARPIIVRRGALADNVPHRDLYLTHGHSLYLGGALVPVEHLVNHRSILWEERAQVVEYYHIELADHDVLFAEGAPAETYHDADNRAVFHNAPAEPADVAVKPTFAPVLHGGDLVESLWAGLFERAGGQPERSLTDDPDLHLLVDGERIDSKRPAEGVYHFTVGRPPASGLLLRSRRSVPSLLGVNRSDHRPLGVAITQIVLDHAGVPTYFDCDQPQFREGGCYPHEDGYCWTDGEFALPARFFTLLYGPFTLAVHTEPHYDMRYPAASPLANAA